MRVGATRFILSLVVARKSAAAADNDGSPRSSLGGQRKSKPGASMTAPTGKGYAVASPNCCPSWPWALSAGPCSVTIRSRGSQYVIRTQTYGGRGQGHTPVIRTSKQPSPKMLVTSRSRPPPSWASATDRRRHEPLAECPKGTSGESCHSGAHPPISVASATPAATTDRQRRLTAGPP